MTLTKSDVEWIEHYLRKLYFVSWDRFVIDPEQLVIQMYGWIDRKDSYKDFCYIEFAPQIHKVFPVITSSKKYSEKIVEICSGKNAPHYDCERIEDKFNILNSIKLTKEEL